MNRRQVAIVIALRRIGKPATAKQIAEMMADIWRGDFALDVVGGVIAGDLAWLRKQGKLHRRLVYTNEFFRSRTKLVFGHQKTIQATVNYWWISPIPYRFVP